MLENNTKISFAFSNVLATLFIALGLLSAGYFISRAVYQAKITEHYITVKGLAERQVKADLAAWEIYFQETDNDLVAANKRIDQDQQIVMAYLKKNGFKTAELELRPTKVNDLFADAYRSSSQTDKYRYILTSGIRVRSSQVDLVRQLSQTTGTLIKEGIPLSFKTGDYGSDLNPNPSYYFTQLDQIRPVMLSESTRSAYLVADQFAKDTASQLGGIRRASQGVFQITSLDASEPDSQAQAASVYKKVRLVTTIDYFLNGK